MNEKDLTFVLRFRNEAARALKAVQGQFGKMARAVKLAQAQLDKIGRSLQGVGRKLKEAGAQAEKFGRRLSEIGGTFSARLTAPLALAGAGIVKVAGDFEASLNKVQAISGATAEEFNQLRDAAADLGATTAFTATDAANGLVFLSKTGLDTTESLSALPNVLNLAAASGLDLATSADIVTNITKGFQQNLDQLPKSIDTLSTAFVSANVDIQGLSTSFRDVGPVFASNNQTFEDTAAILGVLGDAGIQGSKAGTSLRRVFLNLQVDVQKSGGVLNQLGVSIRDSEGNFRSLIDILGDLEQAGINSDQALKLFGVRGLASASVLLDKGADSLREFSGLLNDTSGTAERLQKVQLRGLFGAFRQLTSAVESVAIKIGDSGLLKDLTAVVEKAAEFVRGLRGTSAEVLKLAVVVGTALAAIGPFLATIGFASIGIGALTTALGTAASAFGTLFTTLARLPQIITAATVAFRAFTVALLTNPLGILAVAIGAAVAALITFKDSVINIGDETFTVWDLVVSTVQVAAENIALTATFILDAFSEMWSLISGFALDAVGDINLSFSDVFNAAKATVDAIIKSFQLLGTSLALVGSTITTIFDNVFSSIKKAGSAAAEGVVKIFKGDFEGAAESFRQSISGVDLFAGIPEQAAAAAEEVNKILDPNNSPIELFFENIAKRAGSRFNARLSAELKKAPLPGTGNPGDPTADVNTEDAGEKQGESFATGFLKGWNQGAEEFIQSAANATAQGQQFFEDFADASDEAIKGLIRNGKIDFKEFGVSILESISDIFTARLKGQFLQALGFGGEGGQEAQIPALLGGGGGGGLLGGLGGLAGIGGGQEGGEGQQNPVVSAINGLGGRIGGFFSNLGTQFTTNLSGLGGSLLNGLTSLGSTLTSALSSLGSVFSSGLNSLGGLFSGGGGGGGFGGIIGGLLGGLFAEGGYSTAPKAMTMIPPKMLQGAPKFQNGGLSDGGIPAILHPGEAVVPLPDGRSIPVDMGGQSGNTTVVNFNLPEGTDAESFRRNQGQIAARTASTIQRANLRNN